jgi:hypothetical protein
MIKAFKFCAQAIFYFVGKDTPPGSQNLSYYSTYYSQNYHYSTFKNSLIIHEENAKKNHKRVVSLYVDKDFPSFT